MVPCSIHWNRRVQADISSSPTGHFNIIDLVHMEMLIVGNTGPLTTRSTLMALRDWTDEGRLHQASGNRFVFRSRCGLRHWVPSFLMSFPPRTRFWHSMICCKAGVYLFPKPFDQKVAKVLSADPAEVVGHRNETPPWRMGCNQVMVSLLMFLSKSVCHILHCSAAHPVGDVRRVARTGAL